MESTEDHYKERARANSFILDYKIERFVTMSGGSEFHREDNLGTK